MLSFTTRPKAGSEDPTFEREIDYHIASEVNGIKGKLVKHGRK
jgi:hypothetical protein